MKRLILSRLWMLISIIILTTGQAWAQTTEPTTTQRVFTSIKELRDGAQTNGNQHDDVVVKFEDSNPATVVAVMKNSEKDYADEKFVNSFFIVDKSNYGLWVSPKGVYDKNLFATWNLKIGSKITGSIIGDYRQNDSGMPYFGSLLKSVKIGETSYQTALTINRDGEASGTKEAVYPCTKVDDVNTIAKNNDAASYGPYLNTIIQVPGTIKKGTNNEYYLVQDENTGTGTDYRDKRIYFSCSQLPNINIDDYVGTSGTFEGILIKRKDSESKLIVLKDNFFKVNKIYLDENDAEGRVEYLASQGAFDGEVDVYVHRTNLVNSAGAWNTICLPFDLNKEEFKNAFGCELTALAKPTASDESAHQWTGTVNDKGVLSFTKLADTELTIKAGVPYLMQASGEQTCCTKTVRGSENMTPEELKTEDANYYASVGEKTITVNAPYEVKALYNDEIVNGEFYFRGLYGRKKYVDGSTTTLIADGGSQKYQYISTAAGSYLKYLPSGSTLQFNGMRAYFYFPNWNAENNNAAQDASNGTNAKIHVAVMAASTTGISNISAEQTAEQAEVYNLSGQRVDASYKGIVVRNGKKYLCK
nr:hypothetical protein [uncultured Prevotella sp.]